MATPVAIGVNSVAPTLAGKGTGAYTVDPNAARSKPDKGFAALTRAQYQYYLDKGRPQEKLALGDIKDPKLGARLADRAEMGVIKTFMTANSIVGVAADDIAASLDGSDEAARPLAAARRAAAHAVAEAHRARLGVEQVVARVLAAGLEAVDGLPVGPAWFGSGRRARGRSSWSRARASSASALAG